MRDDHLATAFNGKDDNIGRKSEITKIYAMQIWVEYFHISGILIFLQAKQ
jgi:hypothetical protein